MLTVKQTLRCDICGATMQEMEQTAPAGVAIPFVNRNGVYGTTQWRDVCDDCFDPLTKAFWAIKVAKEAGDGE